MKASLVSHREHAAIRILLLRHGNKLAGRHNVWVVQPQVCQATLRV